jgi:hypothetical protein
MSVRTRIARTLRRAVDALEHGRDGGLRRWRSWAGMYAPARRQLSTRFRDAARSHFLIASSPTATSVSDQ